MAQDEFEDAARGVDAGGTDGAQEGQRVWTVGHSTRTAEEFVDLLRENNIERVVDVRSIQGSNRNPQFNSEALAKSLADAGVEYEILEGLGGRRNVSRDVPPETNGWWEHRSFHNYADYAMTDEFDAALEALISAAAEKRTAVMCAEAVWWRCHRRIISDNLLAQGHQVTHIIGDGNAISATLNEGAVVGDGGVVTYPQAAQSD